MIIGAYFGDSHIGWEWREMYWDIEEKNFTLEKAHKKLESLKKKKGEKYCDSLLVKDKK